MATKADGGVGEGNRELEDGAVWKDFAAGWLGGIVGILVCNPLEVLKVRLQTQTSRIPSPRVGGGSRSGTPSPAPWTASELKAVEASLKSPVPIPLPTSASIPKAVRPSLKSLYKAEGVKFIFAGAAAPIIGLAFIDSAFFGGYGLAMEALGQDRQDPTHLSRVFVSGAASGAVCALLQTPIEVIKCRAQAESLPVPSTSSSAKATTLTPKPPTPPPAKLGSWNITKLIWKNDGLKGFYVGGATTAIRDSISSGLFFAAYFAFRRGLRGEHPFEPASQTGEQPKVVMNGTEIGRMFLSGGLAGLFSAIVPYPLDIIKTRLQTSTVESKAHPSLTSSPLNVRSVTRAIHKDGMASYMRNQASVNDLDSLLYKFLKRSQWSAVRGREAEFTIRVMGLKGFLRGLRPTVAYSFLGSACTITTFELALMGLGVEGGGGGVG